MNFTARGMEGSEKRAREAARSDGLLLSCYRRPDEFYRLKYSMLEERLEQVREIDGELAYEKMRRAVGEGQPREGHASGEGKASGEILAASGAQEAGAPWTETRGTGTGLWPQPLGLVFCLRGVGEWAELIRRKHERGNTYEICRAVCLFFSRRCHGARTALSLDAQNTSSVERTP